MKQWKNNFCEIDNNWLITKLFSIPMLFVNVPNTDQMLAFNLLLEQFNGLNSHKPIND